MHLVGWESRSLGTARYGERLQVHIFNFSTGGNRRTHMKMCVSLYLLLTDGSSVLTLAVISALFNFFCFCRRPIIYLLLLLLLLLILLLPTPGSIAMCCVCWLVRSLMCVRLLIQIQPLAAMAGGRREGVCQAGGCARLTDMAPFEPFLARDRIIILSALYAIAVPSVCLSVTRVDR